MGHAFRKAFEACGVEFSPHGMDEIAYVNASCCQVPEDGRFRRAGVNPEHVKSALPAACLTHHPVSNLVKVLEPEVVLTTSAAAYEQLSNEPHLGAVLVLYFHQQLGSHPLWRDAYLDGRRFRASDKPHVDEWAPALARELAARRRGGGSHL